MPNLSQPGSAQGSSSFFETVVEAHFTSARLSPYVECALKGAITYTSNRSRLVQVEKDSALFAGE